MKLLLDQNLSYRLLRDLETMFPGSTHVRQVGLAQADDGAVWSYARQHDFIIVTRDVDFYERALVAGHPPKVLWLTGGNMTSQEVRVLLTNHRGEIENFAADDELSCLLIY